jgi:hypothetical protein
MDRGTFDLVQGFSDRFFVYFEDRDLCRRARALGVEITTSDALSVSHSGGEGSRVALAERSVLSQLGMLQYLTVSHGKPAGQVAGAASVALLALLELALLLRFATPTKMKSRLQAKAVQVAAARKASAQFIRLAGKPEAANPSKLSSPTSTPFR